VNIKTLICLLLVSLSISVGCYNNQTITREELNPAKKDDLKAEFEHRGITVLTKDSLEYKFSKGNYRVQGDTLVGIGVQTIGGDDKPFQGQIPFADITSLTTEEFDLTATIIAIGLPAGLVVGLFVAWANAMSNI
jgi:hypothetical protein